MKENSPKRQHYVQKQYLEGFVGTDGMLAGYNRLKDDHFPAHPEDVAAKRHLYTIHLPDGTDSYEVEYRLTEIENRCIPFVVKLANGDYDAAGPDTLARTAIAEYMTIQFRRTPDQQLMLKSLVDLQYRGEIDWSLRKAGLVGLRDTLESWRKEPVSLDDARSFLAVATEKLREGDGRLFPDNEELITRIFQEVEKYKERLLNLNWRVIRDPEGSFVVCDRPVVLWKSDNRRVAASGVSFTDATHVYFPLCRLALLVLSNEFASPWSVDTVRKGEATKFNRRIANWSWQQVYGPSSPEFMNHLALPKVGPSLLVNGLPIVDESDLWPQLVESLLAHDEWPGFTVVFGAIPN